MKQIVQSYRSGGIHVAEVPRPALQPGGLVVRNICSLISPGTERQGVELARKSLLGKARARPDLVGKVLAKARRDGVATAVRAALSRLDEWQPLGYSCAGEVLEVGRGAEEFQVGDLVACAGARYAAHAELVFVPKNLAARAPEGLSPEEAAFATMGSIAMQGLRQAQVTVGERVAVIGLGLIGQLTCQLVSAAGAFAFGIDTDPQKAELARRLGAADALSRDDPLLARWAERCTGGIGFDSVIIAAATASSDPVELAGEIARDRATVVAVGAVGMAIPRRTYYKKEMTFKLSRSYGPGRYDPVYEEKGIDYPVGYVRWTERRNMEAFLALAAAGKINVRGLITHQFRIEEAVRAYEVVTAEGDELHLGMLLHYDQSEEGGGSDVAPRCSAVPPRPSSLAPGASRHVRVGVIGAGRFARGVLLPALTRTKQCVLRGVASAGGLSARQAQDRHGFAYCTSDASDVLSDGETDAVVIATPHNLHGRLVCEALAQGKHVFVEKPLCTSESELYEIEAALHTHPGQVLAVGCNRRFSPFTTWLRERLAGAAPLIVSYRVNAGPPPQDHWSGDPAIGGGRIVGEVCHFVDWMVSVCGSLPKGVSAQPLAEGADSAVLTVEFHDGSVGTIVYAACGAAGLAKERDEVFGGGLAAELDNFRAARLWGRGRGQRLRRFSQQKGHREELLAFLEAVRQGEPPVPCDEVFAVARATFAMEESLRVGGRVALPRPSLDCGAHTR